MIAFALLFVPILTIILSAAGKAALLTWLMGGGFGMFALLFIVFKMFGK